MASNPPLPLLRSRRTAEGAPGVEDLQAALRPAWVDVDLAALEHNLAGSASGSPARLGRRRPPQVMAVVKADAYGHGAVGVSPRPRGGGGGLARRRAARGGGRDPPRRRPAADPGARHGAAREDRPLRPLRAHPDPLVARRARCAGATGRRGSASRSAVHLKVDTGMGRLGVAIDEVPRALAILRGSPGLRLAGLLSHFGDADDLAARAIRPRKSASPRCSPC